MAKMRRILKFNRNVKGIHGSQRQALGSSTGLAARGFAAKRIAVVKKAPGPFLEPRQAGKTAT
ncbi:MAG: hypothetical protein LBU47_03785 [Christensenellaceae bacterium]|nr:hypothetical protein [Christensenellaceae bacterium]